MSDYSEKKSNDIALVEVKEEFHRPVIEFHSGQLLTIYTELNTILSALEEKYRYCPDVGISGDTPRRDFVVSRFCRLKKICDSISSYLLDLDDYHNAISELVVDNINTN